jgi:flagellar hook-associated protein 2
VIDGVSLTLNSVSSGAPETLTVSENRGAVRDAIEGFVSAFNSFITTANNLTRFDAETGVAGALQGDFTARSVISQVRNAVTGAAQGLTGSFSTIAEIGITSAADGTLEINDSRLDAALEDNFESVAGVFTQAGRSSNSSLSVLGTTAATQLGSYEVVITDTGAISGTLAGTIGGEPATVDGTVLIGAVGTAAEGLRIDVGNAGLGSLGDVTVSQGIIAPLENLLSGFLGSGAVLDSRTEGLQASIDAIEDDREALNLRLEGIEARFRRQFNALDVLLANLSSTGDFLIRQLDSIPIPGVNSDN